MKLFYKLMDGGQLPKYGSLDAAAFDLRIPEDVALGPLEMRKVGLKIKFEVPKGYGLIILPRSSTEVSLWNTIGLIDPDYRGEIFLKMENKTIKDLWFNKGDRIVQALLVPTPRVIFERKQELTKTVRGEGGFGSTGIK